MQRVFAWGPRTGKQSGPGRESSTRGRSARAARLAQEVAAQRVDDVAATAVVHGLNERLEVRSVCVGRDCLYDLAKALAE